MTDTLAAKVTAAPLEKARRPARRPVNKRGWLRKGTLAVATDWVLIIALVAVTILAIAAPTLAPYDPVQPVGVPRLPPLSDGHLLGTDSIGRDTLSRVLIGMQTSWKLSILVTVLGLIIGAIVGVIAAVCGGWIDTVLMRITEVFLALPSMIVAVAVAAALGPGLTNTVIAVLIVWWPYYARIIRSETKAIVSRPHIEAARMAGVNGFGIVWRHVLPGVIPTAIVTASLDIGNVVMTLAALSFLGLGQPAPAPELGADTSRSLVELLDAWWIPLIPGLVVMGLGLVSNLAGDALRNRIAGRR